MRAKRGPRRFELRWVLSAGAFAALGGCTAILGDFNTGPGGSEDGGGSPEAQTLAMDGSSGESGAEGAPADGEGIGDGGAEAAEDAPALDATDGATDAGPSLLDCGTWVFASPIVLETLSTGTRRVVGALSVTPLAGGDVRVVAGKSGTEPFSVYTLDRSVPDASPPVTVLSPSTSYFQASAASFHRGPGNTGYTVILASTRASAMVSATYEAFVLQDSMASTGPLPAPYAVYQLTPTQPAPSAIEVLPYTEAELFTAVETGSTPTFDLGAGIATSTTPISTLFPVATSSYQDDFTRSAFFHDTVKSMVYIYATNDSASPGISGWAVADTVPADAGAPRKRAVSALGATIRAMGENTSGLAAADIAYEESATNLAGLITSVNVRAGTIAYAASMPDLDTWVSTDLPIVKSFGNVFNAPAVTGNAIGGNGVSSGSIWSKDEIMLLGPGVHAAGVVDAGNGGVPFGVNALWFDATGTIHSDMTGNNRLLPAVGDIVTSTAAPIAIASNGTSARWAFAYVETKTDDAGDFYDVVEYNELTCQ